MDDSASFVRKVVFATLYEIGVSEADVNAATKLLAVILDEDATFWFVPTIEAKLGVRVPGSEWEHVVTVGDAIDLLQRHYSRRVHR